MTAPSADRALGIGLVGAGRFGAFCVAAFRRLPGARVVAVMDSDLARAEAIAPAEAAAYGDLEAVLADPAVDIVHIGTPPSLHGRIARQAAESRKHVFVEKPLATSLPDARAAVEAAQEAGVVLTIDYVLRHHPLHRLAIALARSKALGELQQFALDNFASAESLPPEHWFWDPRVSGGIHVEHGVHFFDLATALAGREPDAVFGTMQACADGRVDRASALVRYGDNMVASFYHAFNRTAPTERTTIRLAFEHGTATLEGWIPTSLRIEGTVAADSLPALQALLRRGLLQESRSRRRGRGDRVHVTASLERPDRQGDYRRAIRSGMAELIAAIREGKRLTVTPEDGLRSLEVALRATPGEVRVDDSS